jgi:hypothetical protein
VTTIMGQHLITTENDTEQARKQQAAAVSAGHYLEVSRKTVVEIHRDNDHPDVKASEIEIGKLDDLKKLIDNTMTFVSGIETFSQHPMTELEAHQADLTKALENLSKKLQAQADKDQGIKAAEHAFNLISNHVTSVASWIDQPLRAFSTYSMQEAAAIECVCEKAFRQGKAGPKKEGSQDYKPAGM